MKFVSSFGKNKLKISELGLYIECNAGWQKIYNGVSAQYFHVSWSYKFKLIKMIQYCGHLDPEIVMWKVWPVVLSAIWWW